MEDKGCICLKSELDVFEKQLIQVAVEGSTFVEVKPVASITQKGPIEFLINNTNSEKYIDPSQIYLHLKAKIVKQDGSDLPETSKSTPINYILNTCFSSLQVFLNDKPINNYANYAYKAYIESLLFTSEAAQNSYLTSSLYIKDTAGKLDNFDPQTSLNKGLKKRHERCKASQEMDLFGLLHFDLAQQPKLLINGVDVRIKLERNKDSFVLMSDVTDTKLQITDASLYVRKVQIAPSVLLGHAKALEIGNIQIPIRKSDLKTFTVPNGTQTHSIANAFLSEIPSRIVLGLVPNKNFSGDERKNPFNFGHSNINYICLRKDGVTYPSNPYTPSAKSYARSYMSLFTDLNKFASTTDIPILYEDYPQGFMLFGFDLTPDYSSDKQDYISTIETSNLSIEMKFSEALTETMTLIVYSQVPKTVQIDKSRNVYTDF